MTCEHPYCDKEATNQMYLKLDRPKKPRVKSAPYWKVCDDHAGMLIQELIEIEAIKTIATELSVSKEALYNVRKLIQTTAEKL